MNDLVLNKIIAGAERGQSSFVLGDSTGAVSKSYSCTEFIHSLTRLPELLADASVQLIAGGRNQNLRLAIPYRGSHLDVLVKSFGKQKLWKDAVDLRYRGSKARRSFMAAQHLRNHGVATPTPIAYLEKRSGHRLLESYFISLYEDEASSFQDELIDSLNSEPSCGELVPLLMRVACLCRAMHDAGYLHYDLGNQNILLTRQPGESSQSAQIIDLNRGRIFAEVSLRQRGQDLSRLNLPSALMHMFLDMYWGSPAPAELIRAHDRHAGLFRLRANTRRLRHPLREARLARQRAANPEARVFPAPKDIWIWDEATDQAFGALNRKQRLKLYPRSRSLRMVKDTVAATIPLYRNYKKAQARAFSAPVELSGRVGMALDPQPQILEKELELLRKLGCTSVLQRFCHHEGRDGLPMKISLLQRLAQDGYRVSLALVQDRQALLQPQAWHDFVVEVLELSHEYICSVEIGHAINRVKWGVWDFHELKSLYEPIKMVRKRFPDLDITGPATIDFEYAFMMAAMKEWPQEVPVAAISHHLYVDRRGAPENPQGGFNSLDKFALAAAIAGHYGVPNERVIVSEVNWPIAGTSIHSPVTSPFEHRLPQTLQDDGGVSEDDYADYMLRYLVLALCSGLVDQVYWWRLVARGYGLVDQDDGGSLRKRPAYKALKHFLHTLGEASFISACLPPAKGKRHGLYEFEFRRPDGEQIVMCWAHGDPIPMPKRANSGVENTLGKRLDKLPRQLGGSPLYLRSSPRD